MNKTAKYTLFALAALAMASCSKSKFHVEGEITQAKDSVLYFENMSLDGPVVLDSVRLGDDGHFAFSADAQPAPEFYRLRIAGQVINVAADSTETVRFRAAYPTMATQYEVEGSDNNVKIKELAAMQVDLLARAFAIDENPELSHQQAVDSINSIVAAYKEKVKADYIYHDPSKPYAYFALFQALGRSLIFNPHNNADDMKAFAAVATAWDVYWPDAERGANLHNITIESIKTRRTLQAQQQGPAIDMSAVSVSGVIDLPLLDNKGKRRSLTEFNGKVVLLDFHAFSAEGSTERIMLMRELYNKYHAQGFEIFQVSVDPNEHFWKTQTAALPWVSVFDPDGVESINLARYNVGVIPTFFLIDKSNSLYKRDVQITDIDAEISKLLK